MTKFAAPPPVVPTPAREDPEQGSLHARAVLCCVAVTLEYLPVAAAALAEPSHHHDPQGLMGAGGLVLVVMFVVLVLVPLLALLAIVLAVLGFRDPRADGTLRAIYATGGALAALPVLAMGAYALFVLVVTALA